jgi:hypothetical protein
MLTTTIPGLRPDVAELLRMKGWKAEIILEEDKSEAMDGREYLTYLKEFVAQADGVPELWVDRSIFWNSTALWVYDEQDQERILGCLVFSLIESKRNNKQGGARFGVHIHHISALGSDADYIEMGTAMLRCLRCLMDCAAVSFKKAGIPALYKEDFVLNQTLEAVVQTRDGPLPLVFIAEVEANKKLDARVQGLMQANGLKETRHAWTVSMGAIIFEG